MISISATECFETGDTFMSEITWTQKDKYCTFFPCVLKSRLECIIVRGWKGWGGGRVKEIE